MYKIAVTITSEMAIDTAIFDSLDMLTIKHAIEDVARKYERETRAAKALESDKGFSDWIEYAGYWGTNAIVRAEVYRKSHFDYKCELPGWPDKYKTDPRRPVLMMGAKSACIGRYANSGSSPDCANGWARRVHKRFLRRIKYSCFESDEHHSNLDELRIIERLDEKHYLSYHVCDQISRYDGVDARPDGGTYRVYIGGNHTWLDENQFRYLKALHNIIKKTHRLDKRARALRLWRKEEARKAA